MRKQTTNAGSAGLGCGAARRKMAEKWRVSRAFGAQTEMGPTLLPTPLSPACGPPRGAILGAWRIAADRLRRARPALAPVPEWLAGRVWSTRNLSLAQPGHFRDRVSAPVATHRASMVTRTGHRWGGWTKFRPFALDGVPCDAPDACRDGPCGLFPRVVQAPQGASPSASFVGSGRLFRMASHPSGQLRYRNR